MISKSTIKLIKSLKHKKVRLKENLFLVEGDKNVSEVLNSSFEIEQLFATKDFLLSNVDVLFRPKSISEVSKESIKKSSLLNNPQDSLALCKLPNKLLFPEVLNDLSIYLDGIQDPGNFGTIIRICDWFGIQHLFCSSDTVDFYNPKVIQASMGSFCRIKAYEIKFSDILKLAKLSGTVISGAYMNGENIYNSELHQNTLIVMGNEGNGIRKEIEDSIDKRLTIPRFNENTESLNVAVATAIICSEFRRRK